MPALTAPALAALPRPPTQPRARSPRAAAPAPAQRAPPARAAALPALVGAARRGAGPCGRSWARAPTRPPRAVASAQPAEETLAQAPRAVAAAVAQSLAACAALMAAERLPLRLVCSLLFGAAVAAAGLRKRALSPSGAAAAFAVGVTSAQCSPAFAAAQLAFFLSSSSLTAFGARRKAAIDGAYKPGQGERTATQVLANGGLPTALALVHAGLAQAGGLAAAAPLAAAILAYYATCSGDTWASELGVLSREPPRLVTTGEVVAAGTNGGVSLAGTAASAAGGLLVGAVFAAFCALPTGAPLLPPRAALALGLLSGLLGSLVDSVLGATVQYSGVDEVSGKVYNRPDAVAGRALRQVAGHDWLSNHMVNFVSATALALLTLGLTATLGL